MPRVVKRSDPQAVKSGPSRCHVPLPQFVSFQLSQLVEKPPSGPQWLHEIKLDGYRMAARVDNGRAQLLTRTGLDWTAKYPSAIAALANLNVKTAYIDGELCGVDETGLPSFARTHAATNGERTGGFFDIVANGIDILSEDVGNNSVINLGVLGPNIDLTIEGDGVFALGGAVPEPSTWAMMLSGFASLGYAGYRRAKESRAA
jgi:hypothetical protein